MPPQAYRYRSHHNAGNDHRHQLFCHAPPRADFGNWVTEYVFLCAKEQAVDEIERIYFSCRDILVISIAVGSRREDDVARRAGVAPSLVCAVLELAERCGLWFLESAAKLQSTIRNNEPDSEAVLEASQELAEIFYECCWTADLEAFLRTFHTWQGSVTQPEAAHQTASL